ncbi:MAG: bifunctional adenosylcobinamide kinase/adenosylcobinamide-phosphate guanylyltransferase [Vulcanococcus sp.]
MVAADPGLIVISGPSRSGKSRWAEHLAASIGTDVVYLATGAPAGEDLAWAERVALHQQRRPPHWRTEEVGAELVAALTQQRAAQQVLLIDSLGTWVAQHLELESGQWRDLTQALLQALERLKQPVLLVCEEVGWGVVPPTAIGGLFRDRMGSLQQQLTSISAQSWLVVAGRAIDVMKLGVSVPLPDHAPGGSLSA